MRPRQSGRPRQIVDVQRIDVAPVGQILRPQQMPRDRSGHQTQNSAPGVAIENPRQTPSYHYSRRYGPRPPCFARATRFGSLLFIGTPEIVERLEQMPETIRLRVLS